MHPAWYINIVLSVLLETLLFWRALYCRMWRRYPFFYFYLVYTAVWSLVFSLPTFIKNSAYPKAYWLSYFVAGSMRYGIVAEMHRYLFPRDSPVRGRANGVVLLALTLLAFVFWMHGSGPGANVLVDSMRKIALSGAVWILVVLGLARYYGIRIGRNVLGMAVGLLIFIGSELVYLAAMDLLPRFWTVWRYVHPIAFVFMLMVWTFGLWSYFPNPRTSLLDKALARKSLPAWQDRWTQVPDILRRVVKP
jgi:hypothetical protein